MGQPYTEKALANEKKYPNIVELQVDGDPLDVELSRDIMLFHKSHGVEPRHGRRITKNNKIYYRWCFDSLPRAHKFIEKFGGVLVENACK